MHTGSDTATAVYALIDRELLERFRTDLAALGGFLEREHIPVAQYRDKRGSDDAVAQALKTLRRHYSGRLIVNDRLALIDRADGVHLGQEDLAALDPDPVMAVERVRARIGDKILGLSTHTADEILLANTLALDYIGLGAYRPTATKRDATARGETLLEIARLSRHPVAIIGGIRWEDTFEAPIRWKVLGSALFERLPRP